MAMGMRGVHVKKRKTTKVQSSKREYINPIPDNRKPATETLNEALGLAASRDREFRNGVDNK